MTIPLRYWDGRGWSDVDDQEPVIMDLKVMLINTPTIAFMRSMDVRLDPAIRLVTSRDHEAVIRELHDEWGHTSDYEAIWESPPSESTPDIEIHADLIRDLHASLILAQKRLEPSLTRNAIQKSIERAETALSDPGSISDGYHTFDELYETRHALWIALCRFEAEFFSHSGAEVWRSMNHSDGTVMDGWFLLGIAVEAGEQMTFHLPMRLWGECDFARTLTRAPLFDGHTSADVLERIRSL